MSGGTNSEPRRARRLSAAKTWLASNPFVRGSQVGGGRARDRRQGVPLSRR